MIKYWYRNLLLSKHPIVFKVQPTWNVTPNNFVGVIEKTGSVSVWDMGDGTKLESNSIDHDYGTTTPQNVFLYLGNYSDVTKIRIGDVGNSDFAGMAKTWPIRIKEFINLTEFVIVFTDQTPTPNDYTFSGIEEYPSSLVKLHQKRGTLKGLVGTSNIQYISLFEVTFDSDTLDVMDTVIDFQIVSTSELDTIVFNGLSNIERFDLTIIAAFEGTIPTLGASLVFFKLRTIGGSGIGITLTNLPSSIIELEIWEANLLNLPTLPTNCEILRTKDITVTYPTLVSSILSLYVEGDWITSSNLSNCTAVTVFYMTDAVIPSPTSSYAFPALLEDMYWIEIDFTNWSGTSFPIPATMQNLEITDAVNTGPSDDFDITAAVSVLKHIKLANCGLISGEVDSYIDDVYVNRASFPVVLISVNRLVLDNSGAGVLLNSAPGGTYQAPSGYVQGDVSNAPVDGTPATAKEQAYVLETQTEQNGDKKYNWDISYA